MISDVTSHLHAKFSLKDLGVIKYFLGTEVKQIGSVVVLQKKQYITELLQKVHMENANSAATPRVVSRELSKDAGIEALLLCCYMSVTLHQISHLVLAKLHSICKHCQASSSPSLILRPAMSSSIVTKK